MAVISFDTLEYSKNLESQGFTVQQAEALAKENKRVFNEFAETQLATKADLFTVKEELKIDLFTMKEELKTDIHQINIQLAVVKWVSFATFALASAVSIKVLFS